MPAGFVVGLLTDNVFKITPGGTITEVIGPAGDGAGNPLDQPADVAALLDHVDGSRLAGCVGEEDGRIESACVDGLAKDALGT